MAFEILEMNFRPNRIMVIFFFSCTFNYYSPSSSLDLQEVGNYWDLFFSRDHVFKKCLLQSSKPSCLDSAVTPRRDLIGWTCPSSGLPWPPQGGAPFLCASAGVAVELEGRMKKPELMQTRHVRGTAGWSPCGTCRRLSELSVVLN